MFLHNSESLKNRVADLIHSDTQLQKQSVDLSISEIHRYTQAASLDFGGSEFKAANTEHINPLKQSNEDNYGWWTLDEGSYKAVFNESLKNSDGSLVIISPHSHANAAGLIVNTQLFSGISRMEALTLNFRVPEAGCNIKENARFAVLHIIEE